ncbi:hypothetical protein T484DRAFT_2145433 [Baffinella frigidus]|nr:hypothetical protein T484DRAFT_2145433 [Cryptophyta sp. CCMP2293]
MSFMASPVSRRQRWTETALHLDASDWAPLGGPYNPRLQTPWSPRKCTQVSFGILALHPSGWPTILKLTCCVCSINPSNLGRGSARSHQIGETK